MAAVVDLVDGQPHATGALGSARQGQLSQWRRNVLCGRYLQRETDPHEIHMVRDHPQIVPLGTGFLAGWW
jgi:hypothetical protein